MIRGGWVCLEAMAAGRPIICLRLGGPGYIVTNETGILVPGDNPKVVVLGLILGLTFLSRIPIFRYQLGKAGRKRLKKEFLWSGKCENMCQI